MNPDFDPRRETAEEFPNSSLRPQASAPLFASQSATTIDALTARGVVQSTEVWLSTSPSEQVSIATRRHRQMLIGALIVMGLACVLQVLPGQRVAFFFLPGWPLPETCPSRSLFHVECPGCGLTRSFIHLAHGQWAASWNVHRVGWFLALAVVMQVPYRLIALRCRNRAPLGTSLPKFYGMLLVALLFVNWLVNVTARFQN